jgi:hypothetical protein
MDADHLSEEERGKIEESHDEIEVSQGATGTRIYDSADDGSSLLGKAEVWCIYHFATSESQALTFFLTDSSDRRLREKPPLCTKKGTRPTLR